VKVDIQLSALFKICQELGRVEQKPVNANPEVTVNQGNNQFFFYKKSYPTLMFCVVRDYSCSKLNGKKI